MIVDDDVDLLALYDFMEVSNDVLIVVREGGLSALKSLYDLNYDVDAVLMDLSMPDIDGIRLTQQIRDNERLRSKHHPIKIFWMTGWPYDENDPLDPVVQASEESDVTEIFTKPVSPVVTIGEIKRILTEGVDNSEA